MGDSRLCGSEHQWPVGVVLYPCFVSITNRLSGGAVNERLPMNSETVEQPATRRPLEPLVRLPLPYYSDESATLYKGDALDILPLIARADYAVLDPPYSMIPNAFAGQDDGAAGTSASPVRLLGEVLKETRRMLPDGGSAAIVCDWRRMPDVSYLATLMGLRLSTCVAWTRGTAGLGGMFRAAWDPMLIMSVGSPSILDKAAVRNVIHADKPRGGSHPYEKPVALWAHYLERVPRGVVVDPFAGVGASGVAAKQCGHKWIGIEIDESFCEITAHRLSQRMLFGGLEPTTELAAG